MRTEVYSWRVSSDKARRELEFVPTEFASTPLMRTLFEVVRCPLTEMIASPRPNSVLFDTLAEVPGESVSNCWKFRVGSGS